MGPDEFKKLLEYNIADQPDRVLRRGETPFDLWSDEARCSLLFNDLDATLKQKPDAYQTLSTILGHDPDDLSYGDDDEGGEGDCLDPESLKEDPGWLYDCVKDLFKNDNVPACTQLLQLVGWTVEPRVPQR